MASYHLSAETRFSAAHTLPGIPKCERFHGHNWRVRLTVRLDGDGLDAQGMGVDFRDIERLARGAVEGFEHQYLNDLPEFAEMPPTAEHLARLVGERVGRALPDVVPAGTLESVEVWEVPEYRVIYRP